MRATSILIAATLAALAAPCAEAQTYPVKPISLVITSAPGGTADFAARLYADVLTRNLGQRVLVENRAGGSGTVAAQYLKQQPADGYTLLQIGSGLPEAMASMQTLPFDSIKDFTYVTPLFKSDTYVAVVDELPVKTIQEYVALARSRPAGVSTAAIGPGSPPTLAMQMLKATTGANLVVVSYRASQDIMNDMLGARLDSTNSSYQTLRPALESKRVRLLAINGYVRSKRFPDVPTFDETGFPGVAVGTWWGLIAPQGMAKPLVDRINAEFTRASQDPELVRRFLDQDLEPYVMAPDRFLAMVTENQERQGKVIRQLGIKAD